MPVVPVSGVLVMVSARSARVLGWPGRVSTTAVLLPRFGSLLFGAPTTAVVMGVPLGGLPLAGILILTVSGGASPSGIVSRVQTAVLPVWVHDQPSPLAGWVTVTPGGRLITTMGLDTGSGPPFCATPV